MSEVYSSNWSETAASNNATPPDGWPEAMARASVNDAAREMMAAVKRWRNRIEPTLTSAGTAPAFTLTPANALSAYAQGQTFTFKTHDVTGGAMTLNVSAIAAKKVFDITGVTQITTGDFIAGTRMMVAYDTALDSAAGGFIWLNRAPVTPSKAVVQQVYTVTGAVATGSTVVPLDDTIPQNTEGDEFMSLAITPKATTNILVIEVIFVSTSNAAVHQITSLFQDSTANALNTISNYNETATGVRTVSMRHIMVAGTVSATTFKVRSGPNTAGTTTFNGFNGGRVFGGVAGSSMRITEYVA